MKRVFGLLLLVSVCLQVSAQRNDISKLKVFIDCRVGCDRRFIRSEITLVDFVLDRLAADVHILITSQPVGSGGAQYQFIFYGQNRYRRHMDTLRFTSPANATASEIRGQMVKYLGFGLTPFIAKTAFASSIVLDLKEDTLLKAPAYENSNHDKWNFWVFRVGINGDLNADRVYKTNRMAANFSADRTTDKLKVGFYTYGSRRRSVYTYEDGNNTTKYKVNNSDYGFFHHLVKSFNSHWSYGYQTSYSNNTFSNQKRKIYFNPAIEYNVYRYREVNNRFFVIRYGLDVTNFHFYDTSIYNKKVQTLYGHRFSTALTLNKKWGTFNSGFYYRNYFKDWNLNSMGVNINADVRITGALSFQIHASGSIVHDQVYLVKGGATEQEVLTRKRQLASSYNYYTSFGLSYRFGSKINNFINPRFEGYGGF